MGGGHVTTCRRCDGTGEIPAPDVSGVSTAVCPHCDGSGEVDVVALMHALETSVVEARQLSDRPIGEKRETCALCGQHFAVVCPNASAPWHRELAAKQ